MSWHCPQHAPPDERTRCQWVSVHSESTASKNAQKPHPGLSLCAHQFLRKCKQALHLRLACLWSSCLPAASSVSQGQALLPPGVLKATQTRWEIHHPASKYFPADRPENHSVSPLPLMRGVIFDCGAPSLPRPFCTLFLLAVKAP